MKCLSLPFTEVSSSYKSDVQDFPVFIYPFLIQGEKGEHLLLLNVNDL